jgi:hypothetical protein
MTPQPKSRTIGHWLVLDDHGDTWRVQCANPGCGAVKNYSRGLMTGAVVPRCSKCGGKVARPQIPPPAGFVPSKPEPADPPELDPILPFGHADNPVDKIASPPVADALFKIFGMVPVAVEQPKPLKGERPLAQQAAQKAKSETKRRARKAKRVRDRRKPDPKPQPKPRRFLPGDVHGAITVLREAAKVGRNRSIIGQCICGKEWRICVQNLPKAKPTCTCVDRWRQTAANKETAARLFAERKAKRASWVLQRKVAEIDRLIGACEVRMAQLQARKAALTPPPTEAQ